jgi:uncharacterized protein YjbI with pentapeptide repeats
VAALLAADRKWHPDKEWLTHLAGLDLRNVSWRWATLMGVHCETTQLDGADLGIANARKALFAQASLKRANLERALLMEGQFQGARLDRARFFAARMNGALFRDATLHGADFRKAILDEAILLRCDLRRTRLDRVSAQGTRFGSCRFDGMTIRRPDFARASFDSCIMTGLRLVDARMPGATFGGSRLAEVQWEGADLRGASFAGATFHMGSSRSGLVESVIASEGTRTGFYTDDYLDLDHKAPEEIRKANLCGADLRGAVVKHTDFYLVDLRGAVYTDAQAEHFARSGAILWSPTPR